MTKDINRPITFVTRASQGIGAGITGEMSKAGCDIAINYNNGYLDGSVRPDAIITRAEVAAIIFRLLAYEDKDVPLAVAFPDVGPTDWYAQPVAYLASRNILLGYPDGTFKPEAPVTRAEFSAMMSRFDRLEASDGSAAFADVAGHWAEAYINSAAIKGWVSGYLDGMFRPENHMTRSEVVSMINRVLYRGIQAEDIPFWAPLFSDLPKTHWAFTAITEASTGHNFIRKPSGFEIWTRSHDVAIK